MPRMFNGKRFGKAGGGHTKREAKVEAARQRKRGKLARVVQAPKRLSRMKGKFKWLVFVRDK